MDVFIDSSFPDYTAATAMKSFDNARGTCRTPSNMTSALRSTNRAVQLLHNE